jgi:hypothetical protein
MVNRLILIILTITFILLGNRILTNHMDDPLKKLAERSANAKHGAPRFDPGQLKYADIDNDHVTFYLRTHAVAVTFDQMAAEEAQLARMYIRKPAGQTHDSEPAYDFDAQDIDDAMIDEVIADFKDHHEAYPEIDVNDLPPDQSDDEKKRDDNECSDEKKWLPDAIHYVPPDYVIKYRLMFFLTVICALIGILVVGYLLELPYNFDKNEAFAIAQKDPALQEFIADMQSSIDQSYAYYYDPAIHSRVNDQSDYMDVELSVWTFNHGSQTGENLTHTELYAIGTFHMIVDLKNDTTISSDKSVVYWPQV